MDTQPKLDTTLKELLVGSKDEVVRRYSRCAVCGSHLHFTQVTDFQRNLTQETAKCPECGIQASQILHRLQ